MVWQNNESVKFTNVVGAVGHCVSAAVLCQLSNEDPYVGSRPIYRVNLYPNIWVLIAQLVERCSAEAIVSNPVDALKIYFRAKI